MAHLWEEAQAGHHVQHVFRRHQMATLEDWLGFWKNPINMLCVMFDESTHRPLFMAWFDLYWPDSIMGHFLGFRSALGQPVRRAGRTLLSAWYDALPWLKLVRGEIPADNALAIRFVLGLGFQPVGRLPDIGPDGVGIIIFYHRRPDHG